MPHPGDCCASCGAEVRGRSSTGAGPVYCSNACRQRAYRQRRRAAEVEPAADCDRSRSAAPPLSVDSFVGRRTELAAIGRLLRTSRLITLFGPAGMGKTRMALELANRVGQAFPGGVHLVELGALARPEFVVQAVASAMGVTERPGTPLIDTLVDSLHGEELLLVLDNCEHVVEACSELVVSLLRRCSGPHIVATSREALRLPGEMIFPSGELPLPDAVQLFADRAAAVAPTFAVGPDNRQLVEVLCARLDQLPLAIELAARMVRLLPLQDIVDRLEDRFALLTAGTRGADARHRDLLTAIEWSYDLLSPVERAVFRRLSMLRGGFELDLATAVSADLDLTAPAVIEVLASLESKSLITTTVGTRGHARFRQLESVRAYAQRQLAQEGERDAAAERLVAWLTELATPLLDRFLTRGDAIERLDIEYDNLLHALEYLADGSDERQLLLVAALVRCGEVRGVAPFGRERLASALRLPDARPAYRSILLEQAAWLAGRHGDPKAALALAGEAVELTRRDAGAAQLCRSLSALGYARQVCGDLTGAIESFDECLRTVRELGQPDATALCLNNLAWACMLAGHLDRAEALIAEALPSCDLGKAALLHTAGVLALERRDLGAAEQRFTDSLRRLDPRSATVTPFALEGLGTAAIRDRRAERGLRLVGAAEAMRRKFGQAEDEWWRERVAMAVARAAEELPARRVSALLGEGRRLAAQQAVTYALGDVWTGSGAPSALSRRERDVAQLVTEGLTNREIAERLGVSERTVESHVEHVRTKLDLRSRAQIAAWVTRQLPATPASRA